MDACVCMYLARLGVPARQLSFDSGSGAPKAMNALLALRRPLLLCSSVKQATRAEPACCWRCLILSCLTFVWEGQERVTWWIARHACSARLHLHPRCGNKHVCEDVLCLHN